jgi:acetyl-CoA acetyltransferase
VVDIVFLFHFFYSHVQVSDGAAAVLLMTRREANKRGLKIIGKFHSFGVAGVPPSLMGIGPAYAIPLALKNASMFESFNLY